MLAVAAVSLEDYLVLKRGDAVRSLLVASIPFLVVGAAVAIRLVDKRIETAGTWVIKEHANAAPIFESASLGIEFRMSNDWFTLQYPCSARPPDRTFQIAAEQDGQEVDYTFVVDRNQVFSSRSQCIAAQAKTDRPVKQIRFSEDSKQGLSWRREATISLPDTFKPLSVSNERWDRGVGRTSDPALLLGDDNFGRLLIKKGDQVLISPTDRRTITSISLAEGTEVLKLDGAPIHLAEGIDPVFGIVRK